LSHAKPPDLPARIDVRCEVDTDTDTETKRLTAPLPRAEDFTPGCLDPWCPSLMPLMVQRLFWMVQPGAANIPQRNASTVDVVRGGLQVVPIGIEKSATAQQARLLYEQALRFVRQGKRDEACACLRQAHLVNPTCRFGRLAIERLQELEASGGVEESSEPPAPRTETKRRAPTEKPQEQDDMNEAERTFQRMRQATQPLGLVPAMTY
jgi:hypothetical protein